MSNAHDTTDAAPRTCLYTGLYLPARPAGKRGPQTVYGSVPAREAFDLGHRVEALIATLAPTVGFTGEARRLLRADLWGLANMGSLPAVGPWQQVDGRVEPFVVKGHGSVRRQAEREAKRVARKAARKAMRKAGRCPITGADVDAAHGNTVYVNDEAELLGRYMRRLAVLLPSLTFTKGAAAMKRDDFKAFANTSQHLG